MRQGIIEFTILVGLWGATFAEPPTYGSNSEEFDINSISSYLDDDSSASSADQKGSSFSYNSYNSGPSSDSGPSYKSAGSSPYSSPSYSGSPYDSPFSSGLGSYNSDHSHSSGFTFPGSSGPVSYGGTDPKIHIPTGLSAYSSAPHSGIGGPFKPQPYTGPPIPAPQHNPIAPLYNPTLHTGPHTFSPGPQFNVAPHVAPHVPSQPFYSPHHGAPSPFSASPPGPSTYNFEKPIVPQTHIPVSPPSHYASGHAGSSPYFSPTPQTYGSSGPGSFGSGHFGSGLSAYKSPYSDYKYGGSNAYSASRPHFSASFNRPNTYESPYSSPVKYSSSSGSRYPRYPSKFTSSASSSRPSYISKSYGSTRPYASNYKTYSGSKPSSYSSYPGSL